MGYKKAWRAFKGGRLPCHAVQFASGTIHVFPDQARQDVARDVSVAIYARVAPPQGEEELEQQLDRLRGFAAARGLCVDEEFSDIGFGMDESCESLRVLLEDSHATVIIVEHFDRLTWLSVEAFEGLLRKTDRELIVINKVPNTMTGAEFEETIRLVCEKHMPGHRLKDYITQQLQQLVRDWHTVEAERKQDLIDRCNHGAEV